MTFPLTTSWLLCNDHKATTILVWTYWKSACHVCLLWRRWGSCKNWRTREVERRLWRTCWMNSRAHRQCRWSLFLFPMFIYYWRLVVVTASTHLHVQRAVSLGEGHWLRCKHSRMNATSINTNLSWIVSQFYCDWMIGQSGVFCKNRDIRIQVRVSRTR